MGKALRGWTTPRENAVRTAPDGLHVFVDWFMSEPDARDRIRWTLRDSLNELLDGQRTGRWAYQQLSKTEKTHLGTVVEVNLTKEFDFDSGDDLDWKIAGLDIDCKFSKDLGGWEIPMEMYLCVDHGDRQGKADHPAIVLWLNDDKGEWAAGLVRITDERLKWRISKKTGEHERGYNRDNKRRIDESSADDVFWLWGGVQRDLPSNLILGLTADARARIFRFPQSGQKRVDQLFREVQGRVVARETVLTIGQQDDAPKRVRDARMHVQPDGIIVLGHQESHPDIARTLGLPVPVKGEWIAVRVVPTQPADPRPAFVLDGVRWAIAQDGEAVVAAPHLPKALPPQP
jgi:hypothetical protein